MANANATCINLSLSGVVCYGVFFNFEKDPAIPMGVNCSGIDNFDPDVAGIGVVVSFTASCLITTLASIVAAVLDYVAGTDQPLLPHRWQPKNITPALREKCLFARRILDRLILDFADQQLVTGFALLISAWVKLHSNAALESLDPALQKQSLRFPNTALPNAEFSLIVFLCMASSSSHLASILVLREYMESHRSSARLRMVLMVIFAAFLAVTIALASSLTAYFAWVIVKIFSIAVDPNTTPPAWVSVLILALCIAVPLLLTMAIFWLCTLQLSPRLKGAVKRNVSSIILARLRRWFRLSKIWHSVVMRLLPQRWRQPFTKTVKRVFWFMVLGNESIIFTFQIILALLSMIWVGLQRLGTPPEFWEQLPSSDGSELVPTRILLCSLHNVAGKGEIASFGQLLPLIFLVLPLFSAYGSYIEENDRRHELANRDSSAYTFIVDPDTPNVPRRPVRKQTQESLGEESELTLLSPGSRRYESDASGFSTAYMPERTYTRNDSQGGAVGMGIRNDDNRSPPNRQYSMGSLDFQSTGSMGWPSGYGTGIDSLHRGRDTNR